METKGGLVLAPSLSTEVRNGDDRPCSVRNPNDPPNAGPGREGSYDHRPHLAHTGDDYSPYLLGGAAALVLFGGWALMAARRLKRR